MFCEDANGGDGGTVVPVSENQTRSSFARQSELPTVAPDTLTSIEVSACDSLPNDLNRKKLETNNSKVIFLVVLCPHFLLYIHLLFCSMKCLQYIQRCILKIRLQINLVFENLLGKDVGGK